VIAKTNPDSRSILQIDQVPIADLHQEAMPYLFPSRYCQSDRLGRLAARLFGGISHPLDQASEVSNWIYQNLEYTGGVTDTATSACDTLVQRAGVCRDFAHLGIALCRALSIPSRYCAGYACELEPQDFHAWFEVSVGNQWFSFDPTKLSSPDGLVRIAHGRDAADASFATVFGAVQLQSMQVNCTSPDYRPFSPAELAGKVILLEP
jgi:transglutaminase-like putative cysteine protease